MDHNLALGDNQTLSATATRDQGQSRFEQILATLGQPFCRGDRHAIYHGDCLDLLGQMPVGSADLTFTSPPYNIGKEYETILPIEDYIYWCTQSGRSHLNCLW